MRFNDETIEDVQSALLTPRQFMRILHCKETAGVDFLTQVDETLVPPFRENEMLMMQKQNSIKVGELGMFIIDGKLRLRLMGADALYSLNPSCPPIYFSHTPTPQCVAKYMGVLSPEWIGVDGGVAL